MNCAESAREVGFEDIMREEKYSQLMAQREEEQDMQREIARKLAKKRKFND